MKLSGLSEWPVIELETPTESDLGEAERLALVSAPRELRPAWRAALELEAQLARIALHAREPALAQLKLAWWRDACGNLSANPVHPLLKTLARTRRGDGQGLLDLVDAWEVVAVGECEYSRAAHELARARAKAIAETLGGSLEDAVLEAAMCWTLATLAMHAPDDDQRNAMLAAARSASLAPLERSLRPLAVLAGLARRAARRGGGALVGDRLSPLAALRLGIFGH